MSLGKVGSKGELFPPKKIREKIGFKAGSSVLYRILNGRLIVEKVPSVEEVLQKPNKIEISIEELKNERKDLF